MKKEVRLVDLKDHAGNMTLSGFVFHEGVYAHPVEITRANNKQCFMDLIETFRDYELSGPPYDRYQELIKDELELAELLKTTLTTAPEWWALHRYYFGGQLDYNCRSNSFSPEDYKGFEFPVKATRFVTLNCNDAAREKRKLIQDEADKQEEAELYAEKEEHGRYLAERNKEISKRNQFLKMTWVLGGPVLAGVFLFWGLKGD